MSLSKGISLRSYSKKLYPDPVPAIFRIKLDGLDADVTPINTPTPIIGIERTDLKGYNFNGIDEYMNMPAYSSLMYGAHLCCSMTAWIKTSFMPSVGLSVLTTGSTTAGGNGFRFGMGADNKILLLTNNQFKSSAGTSINNGQWNCIGFKWDGSLLNFYLNGVPNGTLNQTITGGFNVINGATTTRIASDANSVARLFSGDIDGVRYYNRPLTDEEFLAIANYKA